MPEDAKTDEQPQTVEVSATELEGLKKAKAEFDALIPELEGFTLQDGDKAEKANLRTKEGRELAKKRGSGGFHVSQSMEAVNREKAALAEQVKAGVEAELAKRGKPGDTDSVDVDAVVASALDGLDTAIEGGNAEAIRKGVAKAVSEGVKAALKGHKPESSEPTVTKKDVEEASAKAVDAAERRVAFNTQVRTNPHFKAAAERIAKAMGSNLVEAEAVLVKNFASIPPEEWAGMTPEQAIIEKVAKPRCVDLGIEVKPQSTLDNTNREEPTEGSLSRGGGPGGGGPEPKFANHIEADKYYAKVRAERKAKANNGGKFSVD